MVRLILQHKEETVEDSNNLDAKESYPIVDKKIGCITDEDLIKLRKAEKKKIDWKNKLYLGKYLSKI